LAGSGVLGPLIARVTDGHDLSAEEAEAAFGAIMAGEASEAQMAAFLAALRTKGHAPSEVAGGVRALRAAMIPVTGPSDRPVVDTCGTGGGSVTTFNISTAAALVVAGAGVAVAKHGNRSFTSRSGSADVLEALGVGIEMSPAAMERVLARAGIVFMFAPLLHPAMRHVGGVRRELGFTTIMNVLGPLTNPAGVRRQVVGVADPELLPLLVEALRELGHERALVVHGLPGMDELSPLGPTEVSELVDGEVLCYRVRPEDVGLPLARAGEIAGGSPAENARRILDVLEGREREGARSVTLLNAAAGLLVAGVVEDLARGVERAAESLDSGAARDALETLRTASGEEAKEEPGPP
jgi:anthranilate phosphoribosyltransferase